MASPRNRPSLLPPRQKWLRCIAGEDVGPMVSPLCDDWSLDIPYRWPFEDPEPFPVAHRWHAVSQQMAMAQLCGWDPLFLAAIDFEPINRDAAPHARSAAAGGRHRTESRIDTPYGPLTAITERTSSTSRVEKEWLATREDYPRMCWVAREHLHHVEQTTAAQVAELRARVGELGPVGTWIEEPLVLNRNSPEVFFHALDWPQEFGELHEATIDLTLHRATALREAGLDFLFLPSSGTEATSPTFFRTWLLEASRHLLSTWRGLGGFTVWHCCGHTRAFLEEGFWNHLAPEVLETLSEPPEGNIPGLRWAREKLNEGIVTKGNVRMEVLQRGSEDEVRASVVRVREATRGYRHVLGLSDDIFHDTPLGNARAFVDEARR